MNVKSLAAICQNQIETVTNILDFVVADLTEQEWLTRTVHDENRIGWLAWHIPSIQDFVVQTLIRGVPEVRARPEWQDCAQLDATTLAFGISLEASDAAAQASRPAEVIAYAGAVRDEIVAWLETVTADDFWIVPNGRSHIAQAPQYQNATFSDELDTIIDVPIWRLLMSTCYGHLRYHIGEIETVKKQLRQNKN
jgi:hypothetical protein